MIPHIIHNKIRGERLITLKQELSSQGINNYYLWPAILETLPATGVAKAHKQIIQWAKYLDLPEILIMEDDIKFTANDSFQVFLNKKPPQFDLYFGGIYRGTIINGKTNNFSGMHCYIIPNHFYDTILNADETQHIDNWLSTLNKQYHVCYPMIATQHPGWSDVNREVVNHDDVLYDKELHK